METRKRREGKDTLREINVNDSRSFLPSHLFNIQYNNLKQLQIKSFFLHSFLYSNILFHFRRKKQSAQSLQREREREYENLE